MSIFLTIVIKLDIIKKDNLKNKRGVALTLTKTILAILGDAAINTIESFWPHPYYHTFCKHCGKNISKKSIHKNLYYLKKKGLVKFYKKDGKQKFILTVEGRKKSKVFRLLMELADFVIEPSEHNWDGKWRIFIFDIPERLRKYRDFLRTELSSLGFYQLQKSVWIHPLPIPEKLWSEIVDPGLRPFVRIAVIESIDQEEDLMKYFFDKK